MEAGDTNIAKLGTDSQDSNDLQPSDTPGVDKTVFKFSTKDAKPVKKVHLTSKGVEQAKKRLRAFSILKKSSLSPSSAPKPSMNAGSATVFIGKATGVKNQLKQSEPDPNAEPKMPKPPKPGAKQVSESYINTQKKTLAEIEDMKRKMELVELGIPLGLICPPPNSDKAMPTKAMPPIKTFLDSDKVDELIREAKKARAEGKEFKFDYRKLLPDYANPFQRKKDAPETASLVPVEQNRRSRDKRRSIKAYNIKRQSYKGKDKYRDEKYKSKGDKYREKEKSKDDDARSKEVKSREQDNKSKEREPKKENARKDLVINEKEAEVNLKDFVVCDSWSDNEDKSKDSTPKLEETKKSKENSPTAIRPESKIIDPMQQLRESLAKNDIPKDIPKPKLERLKPVIDSFKFEIEDPDDDDVLDMFAENPISEKFSKLKSKKEPEDSPMDSVFDYDDVKDETFEGMADDTFLESVINEIKQEEMDETSQDKGLVEYDESPSKDEFPGSVTPEMDDRTRLLHSSKSDYSDSFKSTESGYKSTESLKIGYKSDVELERIVEEKKRELEKMGDDRKMDKYTANSLETWSFVLKICQPLLFRHDRNKCYKETRMVPKLWYTENPKNCNCVKDRKVVYEELEMCKMDLVDSLCSSKQVSKSVELTSRSWYPRDVQCLTDVGSVQASNEWEAEDSQPARAAAEEATGDLSLDKEYRRFMEAVWPEVADAKSETPRSSPARRQATKKKADDDDPRKRKPKKMKMSNESWSQESEVEEEVKDKSYNALQDFLYEALHYNPNPETAVKKGKEKRKRKYSTSTSVTGSSESDTKKRKKIQKKIKDNKKSRSKDAKRRRVSKKNVKKLKDKQKKKKKVIAIDEDSDVYDLEKEKKKKAKKLRKKKLLKLKKKNQKKKKAKAKSSSSSDSSSDSESEPEKKSKRKKKNSDKKKRRKNSESQEQLFDVNILKNIKTERETDDEISKQLQFSPRRQKPREIINVKELQNDFVGNSIQIKKEVEGDDKRKEEENSIVEPVEKQESQESHIESVVEGKQPQTDFKEQLEYQSTPQLRTDEFNNSQCSSQESIYSLKDQPVYEKDESHLRPSSQNSNYSFHDVMASDKYSNNKQAIEEQCSFEQNMRSQGHDSRSDLHDMKSHEQNLQSSEHAMTSQEHDVQSHQLDMKSNEHDSQTSERGIKSQNYDINNYDAHHQENKTTAHEYDQQSYEIHEHDISYSNTTTYNIIHDDTQGHNVMKTHEHDPLTRENDSRNRQHDLQSYKHGLHSHEHDMHSHERDIHSHEHDMRSHEHDIQIHGHDLESQEYEQGNYEIYEEMAMAYQSDVASQRISPPDGISERRIETVVRARTCGEIKCDWRAGDTGAPRVVAPTRPSRWGLKPNEVNIVLTGGSQYPIPVAPAPAPAAPAAPAAPVAQPVYKIQSLANRTDNSNTGYDEAYMDMYGASDKLQYGDCFSTEKGESERRTITPNSSSLDDRIDLALRTTVLGEVAKDLEDAEDKEGREKGILVTKSLGVEVRSVKRVSFADGYKPGQDSDVEGPPVKKKKKSRRLGCAWPCPATHADHVPLWDALPPPPPPAGSPPPPAAAPPPPTHLLRQGRNNMPGLLPSPLHAHKFDPNSMAAFMPPEPPPGLISFQNLSSLV